MIFTRGGEPLDYIITGVGDKKALREGEARRAKKVAARPVQYLVGFTRVQVQTN
jgi:hypothetical protein